VSGIIWEKVIKQYTGEATNEERVKELISQLESKLDGYEAILSKQKYLAGNVRLSHPRNMPKSCRYDELLVQEVTLADPFHLPNGSIVIDQLGLGSLEKRPNVQRQAIYSSLEV